MKGAVCKSFCVQHAMNVAYVACLAGEEHDKHGHDDKDGEHEHDDDDDGDDDG